MPNAAETIPRCELDRFHSTKRPKKIPLLQLADQSQSGCKSRKAPVPASTPFTSPLIDPVPLIASRGQVLKVTSSIQSLQCTPPATGFPFVLCVLREILEAAGC
jgi:hypothetical protein